MKTTPDWARMHERARYDHPERYAPDGTPLVNVRPICRHGPLDKQRGMCDGQASSWAHRLTEWNRKHGPEPEVPDDDDATLDVVVEVQHVDAHDLTRPAPYWLNDHDDAVVDHIARAPSHPPSGNATETDPPPRSFSPDDIPV